MKRYLIFLAIFLVACRRPEEKPEPAVQIVTPNAPVILISVDSVRADHLPAYGYKRIATPNLDSLRRDSILYTSAWSHVPLTLPSHVSVLTGQLPADHGVRGDVGFPFDAAAHTTIPSLLKRAGYATGAAVSAYLLRGASGLGNAFDFYDDEMVVRDDENLDHIQRAGTATLASAEEWLTDHAGQPFFFMLHLFEPHAPYETSYDAEIVAADALVGRFLDSLRAKGIYDRAVIVFLSDHGEGLGQHGEEEHGIFLYRESLHVPLMLKLPQSQLGGKSVSKPVQLIDVFPTITSVLGIQTPAGLKGHSLLDDRRARRIYSESIYPRIHHGWSELRSVVNDKFHFIEAPRPELYALSDLGERRNIAPRQREIVASMRKAIGATSPNRLRDPKNHVAEMRMLSAAITAPQFRAILSRNDQFTEAWIGLARALEREKKYQQAIDAYDRAILVAPSLEGELTLSIASDYLLLGKPDEAAAHAQIGVTTNPGRARLILARAAVMKGDLETAAREAAQAISALGYRLPALIAMAEILVKQGRVADAAGIIDQAFEEAQAKKLEVPPELDRLRAEVRHESRTP